MQIRYIFTAFNLHTLREAPKAAARRASPQYEGPKTLESTSPSPSEGEEENAGADVVAEQLVEVGDDIVPDDDTARRKRSKGPSRGTLPCDFVFLFLRTPIFYR